MGGVLKETISGLLSMQFPFPSGHARASLLEKKAERLSRPLLVSDG
jgi:hypothetical protein